eukprot:1210092-Pyramimonas_sp.AAC.1
MASKTAKMASKMPPRRPKTASKTARMAPRCLQDGPRYTPDGLRWAQEAPQRPPRWRSQEVLQEGPNWPQSLICH